MAMKATWIQEIKSWLDAELESAKRAVMRSSQPKAKAEPNRKVELVRNLQRMRRNLFDAYDAIEESAQAGSVVPFADFEAAFPKTAKKLKEKIEPMSELAQKQKAIAGAMGELLDCQADSSAWF